MVKKPGARKLSGAMMSLFLDKRARAALQASQAQNTRAGGTRSSAAGGPPQPVSPPDTPSVTPTNTPHPTQEEINARLDQAVERRAQRAGTPDRQALIEDALRIHADKSKILDDLPEEQKQKLKAMAMMALVKPNGGPNGGPGGGE